MDQETCCTSQVRTCKVVIVDDHEAWRIQVRRIVQARPEWKIISEACDGAEAVQKAVELEPDVIILDIGMPKLNGIDAARRIRQDCPYSQIVFLTQDEDRDLMREALAIGGTRYVLKTNASIQLVEAISSVLVDRRD